MSQYTIKDSAGREVFQFNSSHAALYIGANGNEGDIIVRDSSGRDVFHFNAAAAALYIGATGNEGDIIVKDGQGRNVFHFNSEHAALYVGASGNEGDIIVRDGEGRDVFHFDARNAVLYVGANGNEGDIIVRDGAGRQVMHFDSNYAALYVGANGNEGDVIVRDGSGAERIRLDGGSGDIKLSGADCAEEFLVSAQDIMPGTVLVIGDGNLKPCQDPYDRRVAGIVSGANGYSPGIILDRVGGSNRLPVALTGKTYCRVDAQYGPIEVGDLLTTSSTPGHAMKAQDHEMSFGAVLGKALASLPSGKGMIPVLVTLN